MLEPIINSIFILILPSPVFFLVRSLTSFFYSSFTVEIDIAHLSTMLIVSLWTRSPRVNGWWLMRQDLEGRCEIWRIKGCRGSRNAGQGSHDARAQFRAIVDRFEGHLVEHGRLWDSRPVVFVRCGLLDFSRPLRCLACLALLGLLNHDDNRLELRDLGNPLWVCAMLASPNLGLLRSRDLSVASPRVACPRQPLWPDLSNNSKLSLLQFQIFVFTKVLYANSAQENSLT